MTELKISGLAGGLAGAAEACIALALMVPPFFLGGRCAVAQLILALLVSLAAGCCILSKRGGGELCFSWRAGEFVVPAAALVVSLVMWLRLPPALVRAAAPGIGRLLSAWTNAPLVGLAGSGWAYLSVCPGLSKDATLLFLVYATLFWTTLGSLRTPAAAGRILKILFLSGLGVAVTGLVHYLFGNGKYYGLWQPWWVKPEHQLRVPFTNRNHFAGYLVLTLAPGILWLSRLWRRSAGESAVLLLSAGLALVLAAIVLAQSRAGILLALGTGAIAAGSVCRAQRFLVGLGALALVVGTALALGISLGCEDSFQRLRLLLAEGQSIDQLTNHRLRLWQADLHALLDFPLFGSGPGSHAYVYPLYLENREQFSYTHAENCYVQILMECGLLGAAMLAAAVVVLGLRTLAAFRHGLAEPKNGSGPFAGHHRAGHKKFPARFPAGRYAPTRSVVMVVAISLAAALLHALVDFVWYVPAYAAAMAVLCGLTCTFKRRTVPQPIPYPLGGEGGESKVRGLIKPALAAIWLVATIVVLRHFVGCVKAEAAWCDYYALLPSTQDAQRPAAGQVVQELEKRAGHLQRACELRSADPVYQYRLGLIAEEEFSLRAEEKGRVPRIVDLRQALQAKGFATPEEGQRWLADVYGDDLAWLRRAQLHFRQSLLRCPLLGKAYLRLAELCFLDQSPDAAAAYCRQALRVRPHDASLYWQAGWESWIEGDYVTARQWWRDSSLLK
jgi:O-antigen ligase